MYRVYAGTYIFIHLIVRVSFLTTLSPSTPTQVGVRRKGSQITVWIWELVECKIKQLTKIYKYIDELYITLRSLVVEADCITIPIMV